MTQANFETVVINQAELDSAINSARLTKLWKSGSGLVSIPAEQAIEVFGKNPLLFQLVTDIFGMTGLPIIVDGERYGLKLVHNSNQRLIPNVGVGQWSKPVPEYANLDEFDAVDIIVMPTIGPSVSPDRYIALLLVDESGKQQTVFSAQIDSNRLDSALELKDSLS